MELVTIFKNPEQFVDKKVDLKGFIRNHRKQKTYGFINFYDGTCLNEIQIVYDNNLANFDEIQGFYIGSSVELIGTFIKSQGKQSYEIVASKIDLIGKSTENYPLQPKKHSMEYLREIGHLRPRTRLFQAIFRVRSLAAFAIHKFFNDNNYVYVNTPLITSNDGEGAGQTFNVSTLDFSKVKGDIDYGKDFFGKKTCLAVTGQLEAEIFALAFNKVYTFGPTFRAENSNTKTHAAEFWMIEPEIAFCDLNQLMDIEENFLKGVVKYILDNAEEELKFLSSYNGKDLIAMLNELINSKIAKVSHSDAIDILLNSGKKFENLPEHGCDIAKEHEKYLTDEYFKSPVFVYDWPKEIKAFYMRQNPDGKTVAAVDLLVPQAGELMGGSQREERLELLENRMNELHISTEELNWYLDLRRFGGVVHSGFGMGFERLLIYITGVDNIRDVIPFARTPYNCEF